MKLALIGDIHSNKIGLDLALATIKKKKPDQIIFLGDYITDGPDPTSTLDVVRSLGDVIIAGNREESIINYDGSKAEFLNYKPIATTYGDLTEEDKEFVRSLKKYEFLRIEDKKILFIHGKDFFEPDKNMNNMFDRLIEAFDFDICVFAHTHIFLDTEYRGRRFINPGSIGQPTDTPSYKFAYLEVEKGRTSVDLIEFDIVESLDKLNLLYDNSEYKVKNPYWTRLIVKSITDTKDYVSYFMPMLEKGLDEIDASNSEEYNRVYKETFDEFKNMYDF